MVGIVVCINWIVILYPFTDDLADLQIVTWAYDFNRNLTAFFAHVESLSEFRLPIFQYTPLTMTLGHGPV
jgi:hypothetical protein